MPLQMKRCYGKNLHIRNWFFIFSLSFINLLFHLLFSKKCFLEFLFSKVSFLYPGFYFLILVWSGTEE